MISVIDKETTMRLLGLVVISVGVFLLFKLLTKKKENFFQLQEVREEVITAIRNKLDNIPLLQEENALQTQQIDELRSQLELLKNTTITVGDEDSKKGTGSQGKGQGQEKGNVKTGQEMTIWEFLLSLLA